MTVVDVIVADYLAELDRAAPGLVEGFYLVGSVALNDFRPAASDIDFVAVSRQPLDAAAIDVVRRVHAQLADRHPRPLFTGPYVTWADLAGDPRGTVGTEIDGDGVLRTESTGERHPVAWHTLAQHGIAARGPEPGAVDIWTDPAALAESVRQNLDEYWRAWHTKGADPTSNAAHALLTDWGPIWCVLGISRLHYTLTTGEITSKDGAGVYARETMPARWHQIIDESLRLRRQEDGPRYESPEDRRRDTLAFLDFALTDASRG